HVARDRLRAVLGQEDRDREGGGAPASAPSASARAEEERGGGGEDGRGGDGTHHGVRRSRTAKPARSLAGGRLPSATPAVLLREDLRPARDLAGDVAGGRPARGPSGRNRGLRGKRPEHALLEARMGRSEVGEGQRLERDPAALGL